MSKDFRTTLVGGGSPPLQAPKVRQLEEVNVVDEEWITFFHAGQLATLPDEFYLRNLRDYDGDSDLPEIAALVEEYGQLCEDDYAEWAGDEFGKWEPRSIAAEKRIEYKKKYDVEILVPDSLLHLWEARPHLDFLRFIRDGWIIASATGSLEEYGQYFADMPHGGSVESIVRHWLNVLNAGLRVSHARVSHPLVQEEGATIFGASCVQLYNHILEGARYKVCMNESCAQIFVRQQGRAAKDQRKSEGVKYCSSKCARAQAQRELRRRRNAATHSPSDLALEAQREESRVMTMLALAEDRRRQGMPSLGTLLRQKRLELDLDDRIIRRRAAVDAPILIAIEADDFRRYEGQHVHMERWLASLAKLYEMDGKELVARYRSDRLLELSH
ncbi:helix-turn-helix domain-containing protein [Streptomyces sp. NPDC059175]|uniref:helix-turn-helix domain-containing protein n=1 Tax=Streptomyces sp. NPDC059175 TaxID=3346757 RepID=UPI0036B823DD